MDSCVYALIMADVHPSKKYRQIQSVVKANKVSYAIVRVAPRIPLEFDNSFLPYKARKSTVQLPYNR